MNEPHKLYELTYTFFVQEVDEERVKKVKLLTVIE